MIVGTPPIPIGLFIYGWTAEKHVFWFVPIFGTALVGVGLLATFVSQHAKSSTFNLLTSFSDADPDISSRRFHHSRGICIGSEHNSAVSSRLSLALGRPKNVRHSGTRMGQFIARVHSRRNVSYTRASPKIWRAYSDKSSFPSELLIYLT